MKKDGGEEKFIADLIEMTGGTDKSLLGDDCALLNSYTPPILIAADCLNRGVHYDNSFTAPQIAKKVVGVNISDFAAMGGRPKQAILTLSSNREVEFQRFLCKSIVTCLKNKNIQLAGGDLSKSSGEQENISLTLLGPAKPEKLMWRHHGEPGDLLAVSGPLGGPAAILNSKSFNKKLYEIPDLISLGENLAGEGIRCAIDISDGLLKDLGRILQASSVGAKLDPDKIPVASEAKKIAGSRTEALGYALSGGEDYQLLFSFPAVLKPVVKKNNCVIIGKLTGETEKIKFKPSLPAGVKLNKTGYDHFETK